MIGFAILPTCSSTPSWRRKYLGLVWLVLGVAILIFLLATGRKPELARVDKDGTDQDGEAR